MKRFHTLMTEVPAVALRRLAQSAKWLVHSSKIRLQASFRFIFWIVVLACRDWSVKHFTSRQSRSEAFHELID